MGNSGADSYRVTTTLTQAQRRQVEDLAARNGVKVAWLIRRAVERLLEEAKGAPMLPLDFSR